MNLRKPSRTSLKAGAADEYAVRSAGKIVEKTLEGLSLVYADKLSPMFCFDDGLMRDAAEREFPEDIDLMLLRCARQLNIPQDTNILEAVDPQKALENGSYEAFKISGFLS
jgi:hypothetical protein